MTVIFWTGQQMRFMSSIRIHADAMKAAILHTSSKKRLNGAHRRHFITNSKNEKKNYWLQSAITGNGISRHTKQPGQMILQDPNQPDTAGPSTVEAVT